MATAYAGLDLGTTGVRLIIYREGFEVEARYYASSPLRVEGASATHSGGALVEAARYFAEKAAGAGARLLGVSVYRASVATWLPGPSSVGRVGLWLDYAGRASSWSLYARSARFKLLSRLPLLARYASPLSPLPALIAESRRRPGWRVWSVDALVSEALTGRYASEPVNAALLAAFNALTGKPSRLYRLLGYSGEPPQVVMHDEELGRFKGASVAGLVADQQAAFIASGCLDGRCASLVMGTGFFAQAEANPLKALGSSLAVPLPCLAVSTGYTTCVEALGPGMGATLSEAAALAGGYESLEEVARGGCFFRETGVMTPYQPGAPVKPWTPRKLLKPSPGSPTTRSIICAMIGGLVAGLAALMEEASRLADVKLFRAFGGAARASWLLEAAARLAGVTVEAYPGFEASAAGAALLAGLSRGIWGLEYIKDFTPGEPEAVYEGSGEGGVLEDWLAILRGEPSGLYEALPRLLERIESSL